MRTHDQREPLTEGELDRLGEFLKKCKGGKAMNIEEIDGFFSALIAGPEVIMPSEYLSEIFGGEMLDTREFKELDEAKYILELLMRHWNTIAATLNKDEVYVPILLKGENGACLGNDWARGFMRGVEFCHDAWGKLITDEKQGIWMLPVLTLYHEHDEDPEMRPEPIGPEKREEIIVQMAAGIVGAYHYFRPPQQHVASAYAGETGSSPVKIGRNESCPCGSGKKYKRCCGGAMIQ